MERPKVKICGITRLEDAFLAVELGADYLGLNFYPRSPRFVTLEQAQEIAQAVRGRVPLVGVFVNAPAEEVEETATRVGLDLLQFHGDEGPDELAPFGARAIKVVRAEGPVKEGLLAPYAGVWGFLFDVCHPDLYGGTGRTWPYSWVAGAARTKPVFIAGGIGPENVRQALAASGAFGVDVCSRVESSPGVKDRRLIQALFQEVRHGENPIPA